MLIPLTCCIQLIKKNLIILFNCSGECSNVPGKRMKLCVLPSHEDIQVLELMLNILITR